MRLPIGGAGTTLATLRPADAMRVVPSSRPSPADGAENSGLESRGRSAAGSGQAAEYGRAACVASYHRVDYVEKGVRAEGVAAAQRGSGKNSRARLIDGIAGYDVADVTPAATIVVVDAGLTAGINGVAFHRIVIAAHVDAIIDVRAVNLVAGDGVAIAVSRRAFRNSNPDLGVGHGAAANCHQFGVVEENAAGIVVGRLDEVRNGVAGYFAGSAKGNLNSVLRRASGRTQAQHSVAGCRQSALRLLGNDAILLEIVHRAVVDRYRRSA